MSGTFVGSGNSLFPIRILHCFGIKRPEMLQTKYSTYRQKRDAVQLKTQPDTQFFHLNKPHSATGEKYLKI